MELKLNQYNLQTYEKDSSNRTFMELKLRIWTYTKMGFKF